MNSYEPPYTISDEMLKLVSEISEKLGRISVNKDFSNSPHLRKTNSKNQRYVKK